ncbi:metallophosphoesterase family protein [Microlunatus endophyticus]|uniref:metallophosphoesterase family protein n=1 Tax=Microlunatus endophyticus TaxID=1716077 RepID=UPI001663E6FB|nr:metallophosphoesterase family protein [Microlunatus endophyticus]
MLLVHASPGRDDGPGLTVEASDAQLAERGFAECDADLVLTGHTHVPADRTLAGVRLINVGSVSLPTKPRGATWTMVDADETGYRIEHMEAAYDLAEVLAALEATHHPTAAWLEHKLGRDGSG